MASPRGTERSSAIAARLAPWASADGFVPFERFHAVALHDPELGYYRAPERTLGATGDFYTAPHVHPMFGAALAERILEEFEQLGRPKRFRVAEVGPGDGTLASTVLGPLVERLATRTQLDYVLVEPSEPLRARAQERLALASLAAHVREARSLGADGPFEGVVLANELLDALPVRRLVVRSGAWREIGVRWDGGRFAWAEGPCAAVAGPPLPEGALEGTVLEISPTAEGFVREIADHLVGGVAVLIDYGAEEPELLQRPAGGTLQALRGHRDIGDPLDAPGTADLSAFVNFTRVRAAARASGLVERYYGSQAEALGRWGIERLRAAAIADAATPAESVKTQLAAKNLLFGFGNFRVLELGPAGRSP